MNQSQIKLFQIAINSATVVHLDKSKGKVDHATSHQPFLRIYTGCQFNRHYNILSNKILCIYVCIVVNLENGCMDFDHFLLAP